MEHLGPSLGDDTLRRLFDHTAELLCIADRAGYLRAVNPAWEALLGWRPEELCARPYLEFVHPEDIATTRQAGRALRPGASRIRCAHRLRQREGGYRRVEWSATIPPEEPWIYATVRDLGAPGCRVGGCGCCVPTVEVEEAHRHLQAALEALPELLMAVDGDGRVLTSHCGAPELLTIPPARCLGRRLDELLPPALAALAHEALAEARSSGGSTGSTGSTGPSRPSRPLRPARSQGRRCHLDLETGPRWLELSVSCPRPAHPAAAPTYILLARDISDRQAIEEELHAARLRAEEASRAKTHFLANMSHEIRTPMNGIIGMAEVLQPSLRDPAQRRILRVILESGELALNILNDVLDVSKIEAGKLTLERIPFEPSDLARQIENLYSYDAIERSISFAVLRDSGGDIPRLGDPNRLLQILHNLVSNAMKFTERGEVVVSLRADPQRPLRIEVRDTGLGMTEAQLARIFDDFEQADTSVSRRFGGSGLGMAIVRRLVLLMGGTIDLESTLGVGTTVRVELPLEVVAPVVTPLTPLTRLTALTALTALTETPETASEARSSPEPILAGRELLAADDNEINQMVLGAILDQLGATVTMVSSGDEAIARARERRFDLLLLDIAMPERDGVETLRAIRDDEAAAGLPPVPAVAVTAHALADQVASFLEAGFAAHLAKPLRPASLAASLARVLEESA